jgi:hypothetical protein
MEHIGERMNTFYARIGAILVVGLRGKNPHHAPDLPVIACFTGKFPHPYPHNFIV